MVTWIKNSGEFREEQCVKCCHGASGPQSPCAAEYPRLGDCGGGDCMPEGVCPVLILTRRRLVLLAVPARVDARGATGTPTSALAFLLSSLSPSLLLLIYSLWIFLFTFGLSGTECPVYFSCFFWIKLLSDKGTSVAMCLCVCV